MFPFDLNNLPPNFPEKLALIGSVISMVGSIISVIVLILEMEQLEEFEESVASNISFQEQRQLQAMQRQIDELKRELALLKASQPKT